MRDETRNLLSLGLFLASILIMLNAAVSFILGIVSGTFALGIVTLNSHPVNFGFVLLFLIFSVIGGVVGYVIFLNAEKLRKDPKSINWMMIIILSFVAFIFASGYFIGALITLVVGIIGYADQHNLINLSSFGFNTVGTRICKKCGYVNSGNARFCSSCGEKLQEE